MNSPSFSGHLLGLTLLGGSNLFIFPALAPHFYKLGEPLSSGTFLLFTSFSGKALHLVWPLFWCSVYLLFVFGFGPTAKFGPKANRGKK